MELTRHPLAGKQYLAAVTDLLQRIRLEGAFAGLYEAADPQWWWREDDAEIPDRQVFWRDASGRMVACMLQQDAGDEWVNDFICLPSARQVVDETLLPAIVAAIVRADKASTIYVRDDDWILQQALENAGFAQDTVALILAELAIDPVKTVLAPGFRVTSRLEDDQPHHLIRRNGQEIARKLSECSLYRPALDLCIRDASGSVAAYGLFWMDDVTKVGLLEPMRTEAAYQRQGLAGHLIAEGVARLRALGAESIRVNYSPDNQAAANLYHRAGFVDQFRKLTYRRDLQTAEAGSQTPEQLEGKK